MLSIGATADTSNLISRMVGGRDCETQRVNFRSNNFLIVDAITIASFDANDLPGFSQVFLYFGQMSAN